MPFQVPNAVNYPSPLNAVPSRWASDPVEGPKIINCEVDWGAMGGAEKTLNFNLQNNATLNFSQIVALAVDNSECGSDIQFSFPDTETTISIPAYAPYTIVPVFSNQTMFYLSSPNAESEDVTRFGILNSLPPPVAVPTTEEQQFANSYQADITSSGSLQLIPTSVNGTLENVMIACDIYDTSVGTSGTVVMTLKDGKGNVIARGSAATFATAANVSLFQGQMLRVRFQNGLVVQWTSVSIVNGALTANAFYRTP